MKNLLYIIAGLIVIIWAILIFGVDAFQYNSYRAVHLLLLLAGLIVILRLVFNKKLSGK